MPIDIRAQVDVEEWFDTVDPNQEVSAEACVVKLIEECVEFLRADSYEEKHLEMADIAICAIMAAHRLQPQGQYTGDEIWKKLRANKAKDYYVKNGKLMRQKDGRDH